ncbi:MAG: O-antigen ligase family protein [FCB group bacterium]|jgi:O-antigen ligase|nr:O-antigen ligase family protein [FCB group bacterium]
MTGAAQCVVPAGASARCVRAEFYLFLLIVVSVPLAMGPYTAPEPLKWLILDTAAPALLCVWWLRRTGSAGLILRADPITWGLLACLGAATLSVFSAINPGLSVVSISKGLGLLCVYFLAANAPADDRDRDRILWALSGCGLVVALYGIAQHFGYDFYPWASHAELPARRAYSSVGHPTFAASFQAIILPVTVWLGLTRPSRRARAIAFAVALVQLAHVQFTGARGPALALAMACVVIAALVLFDAGRAKRGAAIVALLLLGVAILVVGRAWHEKRSDPLAIREGGLTLRINTWETASRLFVAHPLLGVGAGNYPVASPAAWNELEAYHFMRHNRLNEQVHNEYLQAAAEEGILGLGALLFLVVFSLRQAFRVARSAALTREKYLGLALLASLTVAYVDAFCNFTLQVASPAVALWTLLGVVTFTAHSARAE